MELEVRQLPERSVRARGCVQVCASACVAHLSSVSSPLPAPLFLPGYFPHSVATAFPLSPAAPASASPQGLCAPAPRAALSSRSPPLAAFRPGTPPGHEVGAQDTHVE